MKNLKENLKSDEVLIHMDFCENYLLKYSEEIQSFQKQVSLHTVVVYVKNTEGELLTECFYTLSDNLLHNVAAIWAHLIPILNSIMEKALNITHLNF